MKHFKTYLGAMALALSGCHRVRLIPAKLQNYGMPSRQKFGWNLYLLVMDAWEL